MTTNLQDLQQLIHYSDRGLINDREFCMLLDLSIFARVWREGRLEVIKGKEVTKRMAKCSLCGNWAPAGLYKFWMLYDGLHSWLHFHPECFKRIQEEEPYVRNS